MICDDNALAPTADLFETDSLRPNRILILGSVVLAIVFLSVGCKTEVKNKPYTYKPPVISEEVETNFDGKSSIYSLQSGVQHSNPVAEAIMGYYMVHGIHVSKDIEQGVRLIHNSAEQGFVHGMAMLGNIYVLGKYIPQNCGEGLRWLHLAAEKNDPDAERDIGMCYESGFGLDTNYTTAATWYLKAANQTNYVAMKDLAVLFMKGNGVQKDYEAAKHWLLLAAEKGNYARAMYDLGVLGDSKAFGTNSLTEAVKWYRRSADLGDPLAYWNLAIHYRDGTGVTKDLAQYIFLAEESASQGNYIAQLSLGEAYRLGFGVPQNKELAMSWYQSAATNNYPPAYYFLALGYSEDKTNHESQVKACRYWMLSAQAGNSLAQFKCAVMYMSGTVVNKDYSQYEKWLRKSADGGCPAAEYILGESLFTGSAPFQKNQSDGEKWIRKAAENDYVEAQWRLGTCLMTGRGVIQDSTEAVKWWNRAAEHGYANAQNDLGYALETSAAGEMDLVEACKWDKLAANQGLSTAILNLERVQTKLSDKQYQEAMIRVQDFHANPVKGFNPLQAEEKEDFLPALESPPPIP